MTTTALYNAALANFGKDGGRFGAARHTLPDGSVLICSVKSVAGCSQVARHRRATWHLIKAGDQYSKPLSQKRAAQIIGL